ncbi:hypothetical protein GCM10009801_56250 [Streptomyces albiaxialis]|uniref:Uncharacterized protein n=1 Tax=Streptomyces albiaxialis TaxID=329523 RepID=A0ABN2WHH6_9ACTN
MSDSLRTDSDSSGLRVGEPALIDTGPPSPLSERETRRLSKLAQLAAQSLLTSGDVLTRGHVPLLSGELGSRYLGSNLTWVKLDPYRK